MKKFPRRPLLAAMTVALAGAAQAADGDASMWSLSGFGTLSAVHSDQKQADFVGSPFQPNGAGLTRPTSFGPDSKFGLQVTGKFSSDWSGVLQMVSQHQYDNSYRPMIEWANIKYQATPALSVRAGRIALPTFLLSETRFVGYANPWVRPPTDVYMASSITSNDGVDATYVSHFGDKVNSFSGYFGGSNAKLPSGDIKGKSSWGFNNTLEMGETTLRAGVGSINVDLGLASVQPLLNGLSTFGNAASAVPVASFKAAGAQALALRQKYDLNKIPLKFYTLGASHDAGDWFVMGEYLRFTGKSFFSNSGSWYGTAGYRFGKFTPYATYGKIKSNVESEAAIAAPASLAAGAAGLVGGLNTTKQNFAPTQETISLGLRWDVVKNTAVKVQFDHTKTGATSHGRLANTSAAYVNGSSSNLVSLAVDFVF